MRSVPGDRRAWLAGEVERADWVVPLDSAMGEEVGRLAEYIAANPLQNLQRRVTDLDLPHCAATMARMKTIVDDGVGFAVLDRMPMDDYSLDVILEIYWLLGQFMGRPVAQKWNGDMIYDVRDSGLSYGYGVRGSYTNVELVFHTDNAFARMVPDYVGLLCRYPAVEGGVSRICSLYTVHQRMAERYPDELERLYQPMYFDRQREHAEGAPPVCLAPFFSWNGDRLNARANSSLVRKGYEVAGETMDSLLVSALDAIDSVCSSEDIWYQAALERGQIQYLNNHEVGHYRSAFRDHDDPERKRHLFRLWHRERGSACYDGGYP
jgi:alpha-ketoglutarate-dependent taurine dioxygenase